MAKAICTQVAEWIMTRPEGASLHDVKSHFNLTAKQAAGVICALKRMQRYDTRWVPGSGGPNSKDNVLGVLFVDAINDVVRPRQGRGGLVAIAATHVDGVPDVLTFKSVYSADLIGGFCNVRIYLCLKNPKLVHGGYHWFTEASYGEVVLQAMLHNELLYSN